MQRKRTKNTRSRKKQSNDPVWIYVLLGVICVALIYFIVKTPGDIFKTKVKSPQEAETSRKGKANQEDTVKVQPSAKVDSELDTAIQRAARLLDVPDEAVKRTTEGKEVRYKLPLNRSNLDLVFSNMIIKGEVEKVGGILEKGKETSSRQSLQFTKAGIDKTYKVDIFYDPSYYPVVAQGKAIAIVIDDFGMISGNLLEGFLNADKGLTISILPDMKYSEFTMNRAHALGMETLVHIPMEPLDYPSQDPGKDAILVQLSPQEIERRVERFIKQLPQCKGVNNHMGSLATTEPEVMVAVMNVLQKHNMYFLDSRTSSVSVAYQVAQKSHVKAYQNQIFLDSPNVSDKTLNEKYERILSLAEHNNYVIAITHCHNEAKLAYLEKLIDKLHQAGFTIVPLSRLSNKQLPGII
ncbi:MAG TPA: divergent polysaccharide deacetylase family protein [Candidatus Cloacimonadota bacterium]|nr:divergent polysaccharide deacetylase family protein [Candidatus Cloacimonadota bacterium]